MERIVAMILRRPPRRRGSKVCHGEQDHAHAVLSELGFELTAPERKIDSPKNRSSLLDLALAAR
jgi:hypothetical protein